MKHKNMIDKVFYSDGGVITTLDLRGQEVLVYQPANDLISNKLNYSFSAPTILVFGEGKYTSDEAKEYAKKSGLGRIAAENGGSVIFVNPTEPSGWRKEARGAYENVLIHTQVGQGGFADGVIEIHEKNPDADFRRNFLEKLEMELPEIKSYAIFGSSVRVYVYGIGAGADYIAAHYLCNIKGSSDLGDLGVGEITMSGCTLSGLSVVPTVEKNDIPVVSIGNSREINERLKAFCGKVYVKENQDYYTEYREVIGRNRRWDGRLMPAHVYGEEQIIMEAGEVVIATSGDNQFISRDTHEHTVSYVAFYNRTLNVKNGNVPLLFCFHGGGDSAVATASIAEWPEIASENGFLLIAVEMHLDVTATEVIRLLDKLKEKYSIDKTRIYATGFSMGGAKSWDMYQEYPEVFAAVAPMDATFEPGLNGYGLPAQDWKQDVPVPVFYVAGEDSPAPEAPFHAEKCVKRMADVFQVNQLKVEYNISYDKRAQWANPVLGINGDKVEVHMDAAYPESITTIHYFESQDGNIYTAFAGISNHQHEIRPNTCRLAWNFMRRFRRLQDGTIEIME